MGAARQFGRLTSTGVRLGIWTLICMLAFISSVLVVVQHASWTFDVVDWTAQGLKGESGQIDLLATGGQTHTGAAFDLRRAVRDKVSITLRPNASQGRNVPKHVLSISVPEMEYRTSKEAMQLSHPFDADTILDWMESAGVDAANSKVQLESEVLNNLVYEVAKDQKSGVRSSRSLRSLLRKDASAFDMTRLSSRYGLIINETPDVVPMAVACAANAILWLSGLAIIFVNLFRRRESASEAPPEVTTACIRDDGDHPGPVVARRIPRPGPSWTPSFRERCQPSSHRSSHRTTPPQLSLQTLGSALCGRLVFCSSRCPPGFCGETAAHSFSNLKAVRMRTGTQSDFGICPVRFLTLAPHSARNASAGLTWRSHVPQKTSRCFQVFFLGARRA